MRKQTPRQHKLLFFAVLFCWAIVPNSVWAMVGEKIQSAASTPLSCGLSYSISGNSLTVNGLNNAPHISLKVRNEDWSTYTSCFDNCSDPFTVNGLTLGATYRLSYKFFNENWQITCQDNVEIVIEDNGTGTPSFADVLLDDFQITSVANAGEVATYRFDLVNAGSINATGDYLINAYLSVDDRWSEDDLLVGDVTTGNTGPGTIDDVPGAVTLPDYVAGSYYLILKADIENNIYESNEGNNEIVTSITLLGAQSNGNDCAFNKTYDDLSTFLEEPIVIETNNGYTIHGYSPFSANNQSIKIDDKGNLISIVDQPEEMTSSNQFTIDETFLSPTFNLRLTTPDNKVVFDKSITLSSDQPTSDIFINDDDIFPHQGGYLLYGYHDITGGGFESFLIKLDENGEVLSQSFLPSNQRHFIREVKYGPEGNIYFRTATNLSWDYLMSINEDGQFLWLAELVISSTSRWANGIKVSPDGQYVWALIGSNNQSELKRVNTTTGVPETFVIANILSPNGGYGDSTWPDIIIEEDGSVIVGHYFDDFISVSGFEYGKIDVNGNLIWENLIEDWGVSGLAAGKVSNGYVFLRRAILDAPAGIIKINLDGSLVPECDDSGPGGGEVIPLDCGLGYTFENGLLRIVGDGLNAEHVLIKIFDSNWNVVASCFDNCEDALETANLPEGDYIISVKIYDANWMRICDFKETVSLMNNPSIAVDREKNNVDQKHSPNLLTSQSISLFPNPTTAGIHLQLESFEVALDKIYIVNVLGQVVEMQDVDLLQESGTTYFPLLGLENGMYTLIVEFENRERITKQFVLTRF